MGLSYEQRVLIKERRADSRFKKLFRVDPRPAYAAKVAKEKEADRARKAKEGFTDMGTDYVACDSCGVKSSRRAILRHRGHKGDCPNRPAILLKNIQADT